MYSTYKFSIGSICLGKNGFFNGVIPDFGDSYVAEYNVVVSDSIGNLDTGFGAVSDAADGNYVDHTINERE